MYLNGCGSKRVHSRRSEKEKMKSSSKEGLTGPERKREGLIVSVVEAIFRSNQRLKTVKSISMKYF